MAKVLSSKEVTELINPIAAEWHVIDDGKKIKKTFPIVMFGKEFWI